jgi:hypothetical protein
MINKSGYVGIGNTAPTSQFHVTSSQQELANFTSSASHSVLKINSATGFHPYVRFQTNGVNKWDILVDTNVDALRFYNQTAGADRLYINSSGNVGIGTTSPTSQLHVFSANNKAALFERAGSDKFGFEISGTIFGLYDYTTNSGAGKYLWKTSSGNLFFVESTGSIGIGTVTLDPAYILNVNGKIKAEELKVVVDVPADYVFAPSYSLMPLSEVSKFVKANSHLPNVPSAEEIKREGWQVGEMNNKLLEKVEELTLYLIEMQNQISELKKENADLKKHFEVLANK